MFFTEIVERVASEGALAVAVLTDFSMAWNWVFRSKTFTAVQLSRLFHN